ATGASRKTPPIKNLTQLEGKGVSYCAICDAFFYRKKNVAVIGSGEYALHEAKELVNTAQAVTIFTNGETPSFILDSQIKVIETPIDAIEGDDFVTGVRLKDGTVNALDGIFVAVGIAGSASFARTLGAEIDNSKIVVNEKMATNIPGLYACGDATGGLLQIAKAVYEGAVAGLETVKFIRTSSL
ncbi:MAG: NAD(P)/FAD-dependent oxidoreductase, partial [Bacilli bacterium]